MQHSFKRYKCEICNSEQMIKTNHFGNCLDYCKTCSWKGIGYGRMPGYYLFGVLHRTFICAEKEETITT